MGFFIIAKAVELELWKEQYFEKLQRYYCLRFVYLHHKIFKLPDAMASWFNLDDITLREESALQGPEDENSIVEETSK